jgi:hypothetical protein
MIIKLTIGLILGISTADAKFAYLLQDDWGCCFHWTDATELVQADNYAK